MYPSMYLMLMFSTMATMVSSSRQDEEVTSSPSHLDQLQEVSLDEPNLWQIAASVARFMSNQQQKYKVSEIISARKNLQGSTFQIGVYLVQLDANNEPIITETSPYAMRCDAVVKKTDDEQGESPYKVDNVGCVPPAMIRSRKQKISREPSSKMFDSIESLAQRKRKTNKQFALSNEIDEENNVAESFDYFADQYQQPRFIRNTNYRSPLQSLRQSAPFRVYYSQFYPVPFQYQY